MKTPLYNAHLKLGAKMTEFAGWEMPLQYSSIIDEHKATRAGAGIFDVSHMGQIWMGGNGAFDYVQRLMTNDMSRLLDGKWAYSPFCTPDGGTVDDMIAYPWEGGFLLCVNASNTDKDFDWFKANLPDGVLLENRSAQFAQIALQGPDAKALIEYVPSELLIMRPSSGYTGEKGYELYTAPDNAEKVWDILLGKGAVPCGLGARDTLRMEAALPLYGHELSETVSPLEGGLGRFIKFEKSEFIGREALLSQSEDHQRRMLIGLRSEGRVIPRQGYDVLCNGEPVGKVTSGGPGIFVGGQIAMALVTPCEGDFTVLVRGKPESMELVKLPFYSRPKA